MQTNRAKWLVFADTPLQVYNACCLAQSRPDVLCDLAIYAQFGQHNEYSRIAASTQLFEHIYQILPYAPTTTLQMRLWKIGVYFGSLNIKVPKKIVSSQYEAFAMACPTPATFEMLTLLRNNNPRIETVLYEDGTGSYTGNCFRRLTYLDDMPHGVEKDKWYVSIIKKCISVMHRNGSSQYRPTKLYVKKPELVSYDPPFDVAALQALSERQNAKFSKDKSVNNNKAEIVLLDVPRGAGDKSTGEKEFDEVANGLLKAEMRIGYRAHPRSSVLPDYVSGCSNLSNGLWESIISSPSFSPKLVIGMGSSAQLAYCYISSKKPAQIMLHRIAYQKGSNEYSIREKIYSAVLSTYAQEGLKCVWAPRSVSETINIARAWVVEGTSDEGYVK